ncbi:hypothetical protein RFI_12283 [Reticulomyxa filosa]|uniref:Uncharacterized protein n=1 Tax=Reticulomyxa filosa TaxID=46433 RepID=X6NG80_RETFI|nr:hypothetical protein RFI_12283 [Reticulomyxa filosa]|eukprot:ETO24873.1 hypothetical protein RFI_12283 [Reticulomyxa filosa]
MSEKEKSMPPITRKASEEQQADIELAWEEQIYDKFGRPTLRNSHAVASDTDSHSLYLFGGRSKGGTNNHLMVLSINDKQRGWTLLDTSGDVPCPRKSSSLIYHDGYLYLFGGNYKEKCLDDFYKYDIKSRTWSQIIVKGKTPCARDRHTLTLINEEALVLFGGYANDEKEFLNDLWSFDIKSKTWTLQPEQGAVPSPRFRKAFQ